MSKIVISLSLLFIIFMLLGIYLWYYGNDLRLSFAIDSGVQEHEVTRLKSPDGKVDAVLIERNAGAMSSLQYCVYVVPHEQKPDKKDIMVFGGEKITDLKMSWSEECKLFIQYIAVNADTKPIIYVCKNQTQPLAEGTIYTIEID